MTHSPECLPALRKRARETKAEYMIRRDAGSEARYWQARWELERAEEQEDHSHDGGGDGD